MDQEIILPLGMEPPPSIETVRADDQKKIMKWMLQTYAEPDAVDTTHWTPATALKAHLKFQVEQLKKETEARTRLYNDVHNRKENSGASKLRSTSIAKIIKLFESSAENKKEILEAMRNLSEDAITTILKDPRTPYYMIREIEATDGFAHNQVDLDECIFAGEQYSAARIAAGHYDTSTLISINDIDKYLGTDPSETGPRKITRLDPPVGGFECLNYMRPAEIRIHRSAADFTTTFNRITGNILKGLDWSNIVVAGGSIITTLMHVDSERDSDDEILKPDLDIFFYGLKSPDKANDKVKEIYRVWEGNLPKGKEEEAPQTLVVKNTQTITFFSHYPTRKRTCDSWQPVSNSPRAPSTGHEPVRVADRNSP